MIKRFLWMLAASAALVLGQGKEKEAPQPQHGQSTEDRPR